MRSVNPSTGEMEAALEEHAAGGPAIRKPDLYLHARREAAARRQGFRSWDEKRRAQDKETASWWAAFRAGKIPS